MTLWINGRTEHSNPLLIWTNLQLWSFLCLNSVLNTRNYTSYWESPNMSNCSIDFPMVSAGNASEVPRCPFSQARLKLGKRGATKLHRSGKYKDRFWGSVVSRVAPSLLQRAGFIPDLQCVFSLWPCGFAQCALVSFHISSEPYAVMQWLKQLHHCGTYQNGVWVIRNALSIQQKCLRRVVSRSFCATCNTNCKPELKGKYADMLIYTLLVFPALQPFG